MAALLVLFGNRGLESAEANGDTRTLTLHHLHTDEEITVTYKRDGRYDEDALRRLDHFLRDWRKDEQVHMDPRLFDVVWEVSRDIGREKMIQVVCGYRSPSTNAMLRRRSSGVAELSQHTLGKAMDFYIQGASLEETREAGLRVQRGGVGYYPTSGSPFVHLDVGNVRHWPRMSREQLVRVFPNGRTVHIPSDGQPLSGYALALADIQRRGSALPSQMSLAAAQTAGLDTSAVAAPHAHSVLGWLFQKEDDEDDKAAEAAPPAAPARYSLASLGGASSKADSRTTDSRTADPKSDHARAPARHERTAALAVTVSPATSGAADPTPAAFHVPLHASLADDDLPPWPIRNSDTDRVPLELKLAYAAEAVPADLTSERLDGAGGGYLPAAARTAPRSALAVNLTVPPGLSRVPARSGAPALTVLAVTAVTAAPGMRYDDPWLRAAIVAPPLSRSMTSMFYGDRDFSDLRALMEKPAAAVAMAFSSDPWAGMETGAFRGETAVVLPTVIFPQQTAWLKR